MNRVRSFAGPCLASLFVSMSAADETDAPLIERAATSEDAKFAEVAAVGLDPEEERQVWVEWGESQRPPLSANELAMLVASKRDSIVAYRAVITTNQVGLDGVTEDLETATESYIQPGELFVRTKTRSSRGLQDVTRSFDGEFVRTVALSRYGTWRGELAHYQGPSELYTLHDPVVLSMLVDTEYAFNRRWIPYDLAAWLQDESALVLEEPVILHGRECSVALFGLPAAFRVYLCPDLEFSVVRFEQFRYERDKGTRSVSIARDYSGFSDYQNGHYFAKDVVAEWYAPEGNVTSRRRYRLDEFTLNPQEGTSTARIFFDGLTVRDRVTSTSYRYGRAAGIDEAIALVVREARGESRSSGQERSELVPQDRTDVHDSDDSEYATACGPIACSAAARTIGVELCLADSARRLKWSSGQSTTVGEMARMLSEVPGIGAEAVHCSPVSLAAEVGAGSAAILAVRADSNDPNHAVVVLSEHEGEWLVFDYPHLDVVWTTDELIARWDGLAVIVQGDDEGGWSTRRGSLQLAVGVIGCGVLLAVTRHVVRNHRS